MPFKPLNVEGIEMIQSTSEMEMQEAGAPPGNMVVHNKDVVRTQKVYATITVVVPTLMTIYALVVGFTYGVSFLDVFLFFLFYFLTLMGITVGFHRMLAHRAFVPDRWVKIAFAVFGTWTAQAPVLHWVSNHRRHHMLSDRIGDPHSPHLCGTSFMQRLKGLFHAHIGSMFVNEVTNYVTFAPDLLRDRDLVKINTHYLPIAASGLLLPAAIGGLATQSLWGAWTGLLWGGFVRMFVVHHAIWSITSLAHTLGSKVFESEDQSRNSGWLALLTGGEGWHNTHHAFPRSAIFATSPRQIDIGGAVIWSLEKIGAVRDVRRVTFDDARMKALNENALRH